MTKKRYLITGGLGLIGSAFANALDGSVTIISRSDTNKNRLNRKDATVVLKDLKDVIKKDVEGFDVIYHAASTVHNYHILTDPYIDAETNIQGTIRLLEACKDLKKKPLFIFFSTFFVYGNEYKRTHKPITEESKTDPLALYPATKLCAENIIKMYHRLYGIPYLICRLTNVYGAEENFNSKKKAALNFLIMNAVQGKDLPIYNDGKFYRDYIYVDDVVSALQFLEKKAKNDLFLIGYGKPVKFKDMIDFVLDRTGKKSRVVVVKPPPLHDAVGVDSFVANTSKINKLGWRAKIDYRAGLQRVIDRYTALSKAE
ncbi:MAG: NAD(P)-dependent oxidoreductase [bacterium]|nr:NAD(P)-dependent oxidoreductase [bacterium]